MYYHYPTCALLSVGILLFSVSCEKDKSVEHEETVEADSVSSRIVYGTKDGLWVMNPDGSNRMQITHSVPKDLDYYPSWSPNGKQISFRREPKDGTLGDPATHGAMIINIDGSGLFSITQSYEDKAAAGTPRWSSDGSMLVVTCSCPDGEGIY